MITVYAIKHLPTGYYLPMPNGRGGRGGTHMEPIEVTNVRLPRLYHTEASAKQSLTFWLRGKITVKAHQDFYGDVEEDWHLQPMPHRKREEMAVVPIQLVLPSEGETSHEYQAPERIIAWAWPQTDKEGLWHVSPFMRDGTAEYARLDTVYTRAQVEAMMAEDGFGRLVLDAIGEAEKAMRKFPQPNYVISKVAEEAGEVVKAAIHCAEGRETPENLRGEMKQTIAMLYRLWVEGDQVHGLPPVAAAIRANPTVPSEGEK